MADSAELADSTRGPGERLEEGLVQSPMKSAGVQRRRADEGGEAVEEMIPVAFAAEDLAPFNSADDEVVQGTWVIVATHYNK
jgi:hypothetical protein